MLVAPLPPAQLAAFAECGRERGFECFGLFVAVEAGLLLGRGLPVRAALQVSWCAACCLCMQPGCTPAACFARPCGVSWPHTVRITGLVSSHAHCARGAFEDVFVVNWRETSVHFAAPATAGSCRVCGRAGWQSPALGRGLRWQLHTRARVCASTAPGTPGTWLWGWGRLLR